MNQPVDLSQLPTISHLNRSQKRAFILRDQLKFLDTHHLDSFLEGIASSEPPAYQVRNGKIFPPLTNITLKEKATRLDLGNVRFREQSQSVLRRAHFTIEAGRCEMRESDALPEDDSNLDSVPVDVWLIKNMVALFQGKYEAIDMRKRSLNEIRAFAYNAVKQPTIRVGEGKSLAKLHADNTDVYGNLENGKPSAKRGPGGPILKHPANKRKRIGLDCIPNDVKSETFNSIPEQIKVDLFNTMAKAAFPNFDNVMMASWNVVSVYLGVGSEDSELHRAIVDLNHVLKEFEACYGKSKSKGEGQQGVARGRNTPQSSHSSMAFGTPAGDASKFPCNSRTAANCTDNSEDDAQQNRSQNRRGQLSRNNAEGSLEETTRMISYGRNEPSGRDLPDYANNYGHSPIKLGSKQQLEVPARRGAHHEMHQDQGAAYHANKRSLGVSIKCVQQGNDSRYYQHAQAETSPQKPIHKILEQVHPSLKSSHTIKSAQKAKDNIETNSLDKLFEGYSDEEEEEQETYRDTAAKQEPRTEGAEPMPTSSPGIFLGHSKLGAPKQAPKASGSAPLAPMMHNRKDLDGSERGAH